MRYLFFFLLASLTMVGLSLTTSGDKLETNSPAFQCASTLDLQRHHADSHHRLNTERRLFTEVGKCNVGSESKCKLVFSRHSESAHWTRHINHNITKIVLNSGERLERHHAVCESRILANVGREAFKYISYILDNYNSPQNFAPITVFCQIDPQYRYYTREKFIKDVHQLCLDENNSTSMMKWDFLFLGDEVRDFRYGYDFAEPAPEIFHKLFNSTVDKPFPVKFVPGGCFAVSKSKILSNSEEFYYRLLSTGKDKFSPLNEVNAPILGFVYERSWARIMKSDCENKKPWCCHIGCNMTAVQDWEKLNSIVK